MNPPPTLTFNTPSLHDRTELECRLYIPPDGAPRQPHVYDRTGHRSTAAPVSHCREQLDCDDSSQHASLTRAAVLAHPYANLGGSFDDPAILAAAAELLRQGYIVTTFNFRGAGRSKGSTSWTGLPELADHVSIVGFLLHFLNELGDGSDSRAVAAATAIDLAPGVANSNDNDGATNSTTRDIHALLSARQAATRTDAAAVPQQAPLQRQRRISIVLGGYSYGSRILAHIPSISSIVNRFFSTTLAPGSSELAIRDAAIGIAAKQRAGAQSVSSTILSSSSADAVEDVSPVRGEHSVRLGGSDKLPARRKRTISSPKQIGNAIRRSVETVGNAAGAGRRRRSTANTEDDAASPGPDGSGSAPAGDATSTAIATADSNNNNNNNADPPQSSPHSPSHPLHPSDSSSSIAEQLRQAIDLRFLHISPVLPPAGWLTSPRLDRPLPVTAAPASSASPSSPAPAKMKVAGADMAITDSWADYPSLVLHGHHDQFTAVAKVQHWAEAAVAREKSFHEKAEVRVALFGEESAAATTAQDHFWHSRESTERLTGTLREWLGEVPVGRRLLV